MMTLPISDIIRDSFKLAWKYKYLWLFGLFAGGGTSINFPGGGGDTTLEDIEAAKEWIIAALAVILMIIIAVGILALILHVISKSALIYNIYQIETNGVHGIGAGWDFGVKRFWPMLGLTLLQVIVLMAFLIVLILVEVMLFVVALPLGFLSLLVAIPAAILGMAAVILTWGYAERFLTLESRRVVQAIGDGWQLVREQWKPTLMIGLVKLGIGIAAGLGMLGIGAILFIPAIPLWFLSHGLAIVYGVLVLLPFFVVAGAYLGTFDSSVWTKVFLQLRAPAYAAASSTPAATPPPEEDRPSPPMFE